MNYRKVIRNYAISQVGSEYSGCSDMMIVQKLIDMNLATPNKCEMTKKRAFRFLNTFYKRSLKKGRIKKPIKNKTHQSKSKEFLSSWEWRTLRYEVIKEYGRRCMCCGATPDDGRTVIHVDHIKPRHKHPELSLDRNNLQILCGVCNQGKGAWDETDFRNCIEDEQDKLEREFQEGLVSAARFYQ